MHIWRLARAVYDPLDGEGARLHGGRWNREGTPLVYASGHLSLCVLEQFVHLDPEEVPDDLTAFRVEVPEKLLIERVEGEDLPGGWDRAADHPECQRIGELWAERKSSPVLSVPSAVLPWEMNYLINPRHPKADSIQVVEREVFRFDRRLVRLREE
jgi:RES domain-containing protein